MAYKCFSLPLLSNCNSCYVVNCQFSFSSHFLRKLTSLCTVFGLRHKHTQAIFRTQEWLYTQDHFRNIKTLTINILYKALFLIHQRKTPASDKKYQHRITIEIHVLPQIFCELTYHAKFSAKNQPGVPVTWSIPRCLRIASLDLDRPCSRSEIENELYCWFFGESSSTSHRPL